ncbi:hypothetical protein WA1_25355 [Scytonema hofmannii PCC 7110]|uniref:Uncharacterized protein n=1 Tax=Scytonema hofmannii PCC 7110 TaxID=128403 RepID=A0A139X8B9_9CYAN|nr:hypothetical protein WA1_25355 [Scytonema hofmannii PCC 7110]
MVALVIGGKGRISVASSRGTRPTRWLTKFSLNTITNHLAKPFDPDELIAVVSGLTITLQNRVNSHQYS